MGMGTNVGTTVGSTVDVMAAAGVGTAVAVGADGGTFTTTLMTGLTVLVLVLFDAPPCALAVPPVAFPPSAVTVLVFDKSFALSFTLVSTTV